MSKTRDFIESKRNITTHKLSCFSEASLKKIESLEEDWENIGFVNIGEDEDGYYISNIKYDKDCDITLFTHPIFDNEANENKNVLESYQKGKVSWEDILDNFLADLYYAFRKEK